MMKAKAYPALLQLDRHLRASGNQYLLSVQFEAPVKTNESKDPTLEGYVLPQEYIQFVRQHGTFYFAGLQGKKYCQLMSHAECLEAMKWMVGHVEDDAMGEEPADREEARAEQSVRKRMYPFQYCEDTQTNSFYCFYAGDKQDGDPLIYPVAHDDYRISQHISKYSQRTYSFEEHILELVKDITSNNFP